MADTADLKEAAKHVSELSIAIHRLNDANAGMAKGFADFSSAGNKAWTVISRFLSGTGLWAIQNQFRAIGNTLEVYYLNQTKQMEQQMKTVESNMALAESYADIKKNLDKLEKSDYYKMLEKSGEFNAEEMLKFSREFYEDLVGKMDKGMEKQRKGLRKLFDKNLSDRVKEGGMIKEILSPFGKVTDALFGKKNINIGGQFKKGGGRRAAGEKRRQGFFKQMGENWKKIEDKKILQNMGGFLKNSLAFLGKAMIWFALIVTGIAIIAFILKKAWPSMKKNLKETWKFWKKVGLGILGIIIALFTMIKMAFKGDIVGVIRTFVMKLLPAVASVLGNLFLALVTTAVTIVGSLLEGIMLSIVSGLGWIGRWLGLTGGSNMGSDLNRLNQGALSTVPKYAHGGLHSGGWAWVGERGKELVNLPAGARVHSNADSKTMMGNTININVSGSMGTSDAELRRLADKLSQEINKRVNRTVASSTGF
jgi:hypothetical protein